MTTVSQADLHKSKDVHKALSRKVKVTKEQFMQDFLIDIFSSSVDDSKIVKRVPKFTSDNANDD